MTGRNLAKLLTGGCLALLATASATPLGTKEPEIGLSGGTLRIHQLRVNDGLSHPVARCFCQDRAGFMWVGTEDGLNRYDGYEVRVFRPDGLDAGELYVVTSMFLDGTSQQNEPYHCLVF